MQVPSMKKNKRGGCEIEARCISYKIYSPTKKTPLRIWSRDDEKEEQEPLSTINEEDQKKGKWWGRTAWMEGVKLPKHKYVRHVLKNVSCRAKPWELLAIVGPSGAGKSTFLEILAGKLPFPSSSSPTTPSPAIFVNQKPINKDRFRKISGYVTQRDILFPLLTVRETLLFTAKLRLCLPCHHLSSKVDSLIKELGLEQVAHARTGDDRVRGISGGERRRLSIGVEVIHDPKVLILDEPTSGLDSTSALQIIEMLKTMAVVHGRTVVLSIHQPGFRIVNLFNSILLLADGSVLHNGTVYQLKGLLISSGLEVPLHVNIVEFAIGSIDALRQQHRQKKQKTNEKRDRCTLQQLFQHSKLPENDAINTTTTSVICNTHRLHVCSKGDYANSWVGETVILTHRDMKNVFRTRELFACRIIQMLVWNSKF